MSTWKKLDLIQDPPVYLQADDSVYYACEYLSGGGFQASKANQLISNLKKGKERQGKGDWAHKERAMSQFALMLSHGLPENEVVAAIPCSKCETDPEYYPTGEHVLRKLHNLRPDLHIIRPLRMRETMQSSRKGGSRNPSVIYNNLEWLGGIPPRTQGLFLIDDVVTTGAHFNACKRIICEQHPGMDVCGIFLAKTIWEEED